MVDTPEPLYSLIAPSTRYIDVPVDPLKRMGVEPGGCTFFILPPGSDLPLKYTIGKPLLALEGRKREEWLDLPVSFYREAHGPMVGAAPRPARTRGVREIEF